MRIPKQMEFPSDMPLLFFTIANEEDDNETAKTSKHFYETYITNHDIQNVVTLDAGHYMHWSKVNEMKSQMSWVRQLCEEMNR